MMWLNDLKTLYENWGPTTPNLPGNAKGVLPPVETRDSIRMKGSFGSGDSPANMYAVSQVSGQNPVEQEEERVVDKNRVLMIVKNHLNELDSTSNTDKVALFHLSRIINEIQRL